MLFFPPPPPTLYGYGLAIDCISARKPKPWSLPSSVISDKRVLTEGSLSLDDHDLAQSDPLTSGSSRS